MKKITCVLVLLLMMVVATCSDAEQSAIDKLNDVEKKIYDGLRLFEVDFQFFRHDEALLNLFGLRRFKRLLSRRKNQEKEKSTCFHKCLVEHRGVEPLTF